MAVLSAHPGIGSTVRGIALVARDNFSARYDLDRIKGVFSRPAHALHGQSYAGRILVLNTVKGGVASAWMLRDMAARRLIPAAFLFNRVNPIMAQGAAFAGVPLLDRFDGDVTALIRTGDELLVEPEPGRVTILNR
jgi:predicted aconitase with swiveling domain